MFEASVDGRPYDNDKWGAYYRPYGLEAPDGSTNSNDSESSTPAPQPAQAAPQVTEQAAPEAAPVAQEAPAESGPSSDKAQDILAMIRARQNAS